MPNVSTRQGQTVLDVETLRRDFPILARRVHDRPLVYLDSAASSQKPLSKCLTLCITTIKPPTPISTVACTS